MQCPNCGEETVNINGRQVCLDCGIEVTSGVLGSQTAPVPSVPDSTPSSTQKPIANNTSVPQEEKPIEQDLTSKKEEQTENIAEQVASVQNDNKSKEVPVSFVHPENYNEENSTLPPVSSQPDVEPEKTGEQTIVEPTGTKVEETTNSTSAIPAQTAEPKVKAEELAEANVGVSSVSAEDERKVDIVEPNFNQEEELRKQLKGEKSLDSGSPIFEDKSLENTSVTEVPKTESANSVSAENVVTNKKGSQNVDSISKANQWDNVVSGNTSIESYLDDPVTDEVVNIRGGISTNMEVLPANRMTNGSIKNIIIITSTIAIILITAFVIYLNWNGIISFFYPNVETNLKDIKGIVG